MLIVPRPVVNRKALEIDEEQVLLRAVGEALIERNAQQIIAQSHGLGPKDAHIHEVRLLANDRPEAHLRENVALNIDAGRTFACDYIPAMCGRVIQSSGLLRYAIVDGTNVRDSRVHNYPPRWNAAPSQELLVIRRNHKTGDFEVAEATYRITRIIHENKRVVDWTASTTKIALLIVTAAATAFCATVILPVRSSVLFDLAQSLGPPKYENRSLREDAMTGKRNETPTTVTGLKYPMVDLFTGGTVMPLMLVNVVTTWYFFSLTAPWLFTQAWMQELETERAS